MSNYNYKAIIKEANDLDNQKNQICRDLLIRIGTPRSKSDPNYAVKAISCAFLFSGALVSKQIVKAVKGDDLLIAVLAMRSLFELMINSEYIFNHPQHKMNLIHQRRVCRDIFKLANKKRKASHSRIDNKTIIDRAKEVKLLKLYKKNYRNLSSWSHLMVQTSYVTQGKVKEYFAIHLLQESLCYIHDTISSICVAINLPVDNIWGKKVTLFRDKAINIYKSYIGS